MRPDLYWIAGPWAGKLAISTRPRGGDWLGDEIIGWRDAGLTAIVSLLTSEEAEELDLSQESPLCRSSGLAFTSFPMPDRGVPPSEKAAAAALADILASLRKGDAIAIHCRQGIGRSGLVATSLLGLAGEKAEEALKKVSDARGLSVPETTEQREWVRRFLARRPDQSNSST